MFEEYPYTFNLALNILVLATERSKWNCAFVAGV